MLTKGKCLSTNQLGTLLMLYLSHAHLTSVLVLLGFHLDVVSREASVAMVLVEGAIATIEHIRFRIGKMWVAFCIDSTVLVSDVLGHQGGTMSRVFAVEDQQCFGGLLMLKQLSGQLVFVIEIHSAVYVTAFIFILETTVDDHSLIVETVVFAVQDVYHCVPRDAWKITSLIVREEMWQLGLIRGVEVCYGSERCGTRLLLLSHNLIGVLKHAQRSAELLSWSHQRVGHLTSVLTERGSIPWP